jgi:hypothetical protein
MLVRTLKVPDKYGTYLVPVVDGSFGQIDKLGSGCAGQCHGWIIGLYQIISSRGLNNCVVDLNELFWIAEVIIFVNMSSLEHLWPDDLPEQCNHNTETAPP